MMFKVGDKVKVDFHGIREGTIVKLFDENHAIIELIDPWGDWTIRVLRSFRELQEEERRT